MPRSAKKSVSFVKAARMTLGVPETTGHDVLSIVFSTNVGTCVIDRAVLAARRPQLVAGLVGEHHVARVDAERLEVRAPERRRAPHVEHARDADARLLALGGRLGGA